MTNRTFRTRYFGPTDTKGSRIRVYWQTDQVRAQATVSYDYGARDPHVAAITAATGIPDYRLRIERFTATGHVYREVTG